MLTRIIPLVCNWAPIEKPFQKTRASCFTGVSKTDSKTIKSLRWNTRTRFWNITSKAEESFVISFSYSTWSLLAKMCQRSLQIIVLVALTVLAANQANGNYYLKHTQLSVTKKRLVVCVGKWESISSSYVNSVISKHRSVSLQWQLGCGYG